MWPSVDELVRILEAGVNVVATAAFITGTNFGADRDRLVDACTRGGSSLLGTGISPGFAELVAVTIAGICSRVDKVIVTETADTTFYDSPDTERVAGYGHPIDEPTLPTWHARARRCSARPSPWWPTPSAWRSSTRSSVSPSSPRPPKTS